MIIKYDFISHFYGIFILYKCCVFFNTHKKQTLRSRLEEIIFSIFNEIKVIPREYK